MPPCPHCNNEQDANARFCSSCGKKLVTKDVVAEMQRENASRSSIERIFWLYGLMLIICAGLKLTKIHATWKVMSTVELMITGVIVVFVLMEGGGFLRRMFTGRYQWFMFPLVIIGAVAFSFVVNFIADELQRLNKDVFYSYMYEDTSFPLLFSILSVAVQPAIFEELAFRGIIYDRLGSSMDVNAVIIVSSILFGILHLAPVSLIWLVPIALLAAWLRKQNGHILYGIIFHFTYNLCFVLRDAYDRGMIFNHHTIWIH